MTTWHKIAVSVAPSKTNDFVVADMQEAVSAEIKSPDSVVEDNVDGGGKAGI
jgi:hypothetical protein